MIEDMGLSAECLQTSAEVAKDVATIDNSAFDAEAAAAMRGLPEELLQTKDTHESSIISIIGDADTKIVIILP